MVFYRFEMAERNKWFYETLTLNLYFIAPMKRVQFTGENGSKTNLHESKRIDDIDLNFEDADADSAMKNEHFVTRETILAQSKPKGRKSKQK